MGTTARSRDTANGTTTTRMTRRDDDEEHDLEAE